MGPLSTLFYSFSTIFFTPLSLSFHKPLSFTIFLYPFLLLHNTKLSLPTSFSFLDSCSRKNFLIFSLIHLQTCCTTRTEIQRIISISYTTIVYLIQRLFIYLRYFSLFSNRFTTSWYSCIRK